MNKKALFISRQVLVGLIILQLLNLSVGSPACENDYDYSYSYNKSYDPTETAIEWIVEMKYGQQPAFSYDNSSDTNKNTIKNFHWKTDLQETALPTFYQPVMRSFRGEAPVQKTLSPFADVFLPPPELVLT